MTPILEMEDEIYSSVVVEKMIRSDFNAAEGDIAAPDCENINP
jgi:hypothetical protein